MHLQICLFNAIPSSDHEEEKFQEPMPKLFTPEPETCSLK